MKLKCPACGTPIPAANINIQKLIAVCPNCDNIIQVGSDQPERKIKPPAQFTSYEDDSTAHFAYRWTWRTEPLHFFIMMMVLLVMGLGLFGVNPFLPILIAGFPAYYTVALFFNRTHYVVDDENLMSYTTPLWFPGYGKKLFPLDEITEVVTEEVLDMGKPQDSFLNVYVHTIHDEQRLIATYVNYEHAHFIAQEIRAQLKGEQISEFEHERLVEKVQEKDSIENAQEESPLNDFSELK